jgi:hypothetical protein
MELIPIIMLLSKKTKTRSAGEDVGKRESLDTISGTVNQYSHYGKQLGGSSKAKNRTAI